MNARKTIATVALAASVFGAGAAIGGGFTTQPASVIKVPGGHFDTRTSILWCTGDGWTAATDTRHDGTTWAACM